MGPQSGGTQLAITGQYLNIGSTISAFLDDLPCQVNSTQASSSRITCITSRSNGPRQISHLTLSIDGANRTLEGNPFNYTNDPTIREIKPLISFASGGRMITVHGTNLDTILKPEMVVYIDEEPNPINKTVSTYIYNLKVASTINFWVINIFVLNRTVLISYIMSELISASFYISVKS